MSRSLAFFQPQGPLSRGTLVAQAGCRSGLRSPLSRCMSAPVVYESRGVRCRSGATGDPSPRSGEDPAREAFGGRACLLDAIGKGSG